MNRHAMHKPSFLLLLAAFALAACGNNKTPEVPPLAGADIGGPFTLSDKTGKIYHWSDFNGKYRIIYFGYTFCPDACPMDLRIVTRGLDIYEKENPSMAGKIQPIFVSIDPARDTPQIVGEFAAAFSPKLLGLTGTQQQVADAAKAFAVFYAKGKETSGGYLMDHTRMAYLMNPKGEPMLILSVENGPKELAKALKYWVH